MWAALEKLDYLHKCLTEGGIGHTHNDAAIKVDSVLVKMKNLCITLMMESMSFQLSFFGKKNYAMIKC